MEFQKRPKNCVIYIPCASSHTRDGHKGASWASLKLGTSSWFPTGVTGPQSLGPSVVAFLSHEQGDGSEVEHLRHEPALT